jgi:hypothetical protein
MSSTVNVGLSSNAAFKRLWLGQAASGLGDAFGFVAVPLLVLEVTHSVSAMGEVTALAAAGQLVMGFFSGIIVDRIERRRLMIACDLGRLLLYSSLPFAWWFGRPSLWLIYVVIGLGSALGNLFSVACLAAVANIVDRGDLGSANGRLQGTQALTYVAGAAAAGAVTAHFSAVTALAIDALSFGASALCFASVRFRASTARSTPASEAKSFLTELGAGVRFSLADPVLRALALLQVAVALLASAGLSAAIIDLVIYRLRVDFEESARVVGLCLGLASIGAALGAVSAAKLRRSIGFGVTVVLGTGVQALGLVLAGFGSGVVAVTAGAMLWAAGLTLRAVGANALRQTLTPDALLGRVAAANWTFVYGAAALGAILVTRVAATHASSWTLGVAGLSLFVVTGLGMLTPLGRSAKIQVSDPPQAPRGA